MKLILLAVTSTTPAVTVITAIIIIIISITIITFRKIYQGNAAVETQSGRTWGYPLFLSLNSITILQSSLFTTAGFLVSFDFFFFARLNGDILCFSHEKCK